LKIYLASISTILNVKVFLIWINEHYISLDLLQGIPEERFSMQHADFGPDIFAV